MLVHHHFPLAFLLLPLLATCLEAYRSYDGYKLYRINANNLDQLQAVFGLINSNSVDLDVWKFSPNLGEASEIFVSPSEEVELREFLHKNGLAFDISERDFGQHFRRIEAIRSREQQKAFLFGQNGPEEFNLGQYHPYEAIQQYLKMLAKSHPDFVNASSLGKTFEGRNLAILKLGYPSKNGAKKPIFFLDAGIHAREWIAPAVALNVIDAFVNKPEWHSLLKQMDVHVIPSLNPDGYVFSWEEDRLWRLTRSGPYERNGICESSSSLCHGVDPNRNFPFHWGEASTNRCPCSGNFPGSEALTEPECANLVEHLRSNRHQIRAYLSLHAYSNVIMHAWNYDGDVQPESVDELQALGEEMAKQIANAGGPQFRVGSGPDVLYAASGSSQDFASSLGIKYSYTMELTNGHEFTYPEELISSFAHQVLPGIHVFAKKMAELAGGN